MMGFNRQRGFTMIELMAVLTIASIVSIMVARQFQAKAVDTQVDAMGERAVQVSEAVKYFRQNTSDWPNSVNELVSGGYLREHPDPNMPRYVDQFTLANIGGNRITVRYQTGDVRYARRLAGLLPGGSRSGTEVRYQVDRPGFEASIAAVTEEFYRLDGTTPLEGNMDGGGHDANNFRNISATNNLSAGGNISASGNITASGSMTASNNITAGNYMTARRYNDSDNSSFYMDPSSTSYLNTLSVQNRVYGSSFYDINNDSYYVNPSSTSKLANDLTVEGDIVGDRFVSRSNDSYYLAPEGTSRIRTLYAAQIRDIDNSNYFVNPSLSGQAARFNGHITARGLSIEGSESAGDSCSTYNRGITTDTSGNIMYCDGSSWRSVATRSNFVGRNSGMIDGNDYQGTTSSSRTWSFTTSSLGLSEEAYAVQIYASCGAKDHHNIKFNIRSSAGGGTLRLIDTQAAGSGDQIRTMNTLIVPVNGDNSTIEIIKPSGSQPCEGNGLHVNMIGYFENV
tara:strand:+ start:197 stop:1726 length:1530 start_codon:yes stop_codon:yes gene_type:complete